MKKNILYVFHVSSFGGGALCLLNLVKEVDKEKFNPIVLLKNKGPVCEELEKVGATVVIEPSLEVVPYNRPLFEKNSMFQIIKILISMKKFRRWLLKLEVEILHLNTMMMYPYAVPASRLGTKVIIHIREHWPPNENVTQLNFARKVIKKYVEVVIAINETSKTLLGLPEKTEVVYDWIDFDGRDKFTDFKSIFGENHNNLKVALFLGGIQNTKGALQVVKAFHRKIEADNGRLLFVGCDSKEISYGGLKGTVKRILNLFNYFTYSDQIKKIMQEDGRIECIPSTNQVKSLFEQAYCTVIFPTIPHAIIPIAESIYLGTPVLSADTPEAREYSNQGEGAILFKMNDETQFAEEFKSIYKSRVKQDRRAARNSKFVKRLFSKETNSRKVEEIYNRIL